MCASSELLASAWRAQHCGKPPLRECALSIATDASCGAWRCSGRRQCRPLRIELPSDEREVLEARQLPRLLPLPLQHHAQRDAAEWRRRRRRRPWRAAPEQAHSGCHPRAVNAQRGRQRTVVKELEYLRQLFRQLRNALYWTFIAGTARHDPVAGHKRY